jgi:hypothetical protein
LKKLLELMALPTTGKPKWRDASWREAWNAFRAAISDIPSVRHRLPLSAK